VSDCVGSSFSSSNCKDTAKPVPCGDGTCRSNYVACLRAISDGERRDSLRSSILWAFKRYASREEGPPPGDAEILAAAAAAAAEGAEGAEGGANAPPEGALGEEEEGEGGEVGAMAAPPPPPGAEGTPGEPAAAWRSGGDAYMRAIFGAQGKEDRAGGTRRQVAAPSKERGGEVGGGGRGGRLAASSEVHKWSGTLEYDNSGVVGKRKKKNA
jgi:hypothetical protein